MLGADPNWLAVAAAAALYMVLGGLWYGALFSDVWLRAMDLDEEELEELGEEAGRGYLVSGVAAVALAVALAGLVDALGAATWLSGAGVGAATGVAFVATSQAGATVFEGRPWTLYLLSTGYHLVALTGMGALVAVW